MEDNANLQDHICIIDGYGLIYRTYFALSRNPLTNSSGQNVGAVNGFFNTLHVLLKRGYKNIFCAMDSRTKTFRHEIYSEYKAQRSKTPPDLYTQVDIIEEVLNALGIPIFRCDGYEADDIIATSARVCKENKIALDILTQDKDLQQLVDDNTKVLKVIEGSLTALDEEAVKKTWGVSPKNLLPLLALKGDSSDNIPGVSGVGDKIAARLISEYGDLDGIYKNIDSIKGAALKNNLIKGRDNAYFAQKLITLYNTVPLEAIEKAVSSIKGDCNSDGGAKKGYNFAAAIAIFRKYELPSLASRWGKYYNVPPITNSQTGGQAGSLTALLKSNDSTDATHTCSRDKVGYNSALKGGASGREFNNGGDVIKFQKVEHCNCDGLPLVAMAGDVGSASYNKLSQVIEQYKKSGAILIFTDALGTFKSYKALGFDITNLLGDRGDVLIADIGVARWMINSDNSGFDAKKSSYNEAQLLEEWKSCYKILREMGLIDIFFNIEMKLLPVIFLMEVTGITLDIGAMEKYGREVESRIAQTESAIKNIVGHDFNIASPKQLSQVLFIERGLKGGKKTKTGYSTDNDTLEILARTDEVAKQVIDYRANSKLLSTYIKALPKLCDDEGALHPNFLQNGTATGRLSCHEPNLQNIPVRTEDGRRIRSCFIAKSGNVFVTADYSQIELVVLAHLSDDKNMKAAFDEGLDIHRATASLIFGVDKADVTAQQRRVAKTINFGVLYGMSAFRLSRELSIARSEAQAFIDSYFRKYPAIDEFMKAVIARAECTGVTKTLFGRVRHIANIASPNKMLKAEADRVAVNSTVQGSAADIVKLAMIKVSEALKGTSGKMLLQVHDELIVECIESDAKVISDITKKAMEGVITLSVPLKVSVESGSNWGEFH